jgi:hypothetical protein
MRVGNRPQSRNASLCKHDRIINFENTSTVTLLFFLLHQKNCSMESAFFGPVIAHGIFTFAGLTTSLSLSSSWCSGVANKISNSDSSAASPRESYISTHCLRNTHLISWNDFSSRSMTWTFIVRVRIFCHMRSVQSRVTPPFIRRITQNIDTGGNPVSCPVKRGTPIIFIKYFLICCQNNNPSSFNVSTHNWHSQHTKTIF